MMEMLIYCYIFLLLQHTHTSVAQRNIMSVQAINKCSKPFKYIPCPSSPARPSSRLKRDTHQLCDRSRDSHSVDPEGGGREGVADVAEKLRKVSGRQLQSCRRLILSASK